MQEADISTLYKHVYLVDTEPNITPKYFYLGLQLDSWLFHLKVD